MEKGTRESKRDRMERQEEERERKKARTRERLFRQRSLNTSLSLKPMLQQLLIIT